MRFLKFAVLAALLALPVSSVDAGIIFGSAVDLNFDNLGAFTAVEDVTSINFGNDSVLNGRIAANGTDGAGQIGTPGEGVLSPGDTTNVVGHALIDQVTTISGIVDPLDSGEGFNLVGVLRNVTGEISGFGPSLQNTFDGGFVDIYFDATPETAFDAADLASSVDDILVATFAVTGGETVFLPGGQGGTRILGDLIFNNSDFFGLDSGLDPLDPGSVLQIEINSVDEVLLPSTAFANIDNGTGGVDIGTGFTAGGIGSLDVISQVDGNADFGAVPEPGSMFIFAGVLALGLEPRRRRKRA